MQRDRRRREGNKLVFSKFSMTVSMIISIRNRKRINTVTDFKRKKKDYQ